MLASSTNQWDSFCRADLTRDGVECRCGNTVEMDRRALTRGLFCCAALITVAVVPIARWTPQPPATRTADERALREYTGVYQWDHDAFTYLQMWSEFTGTNQLVAFDESGDVRVLYATDRDRFSAGPGAAVPTPVESRIQFQLNAKGKITSLTWQRRHEAIAQEAALDGLYVIRTSVPAEQLDAAAAVAAYKSLSHVERAFRSIKTVNLQVRTGLPLQRHSRLGRPGQRRGEACLCVTSPSSCCCW